MCHKKINQYVRGIKQKLCCLLAVYCLLFISSGAEAQVFAAPSEHNSQQPIDITSDSLLVSPKVNTAIFSGNVNVIQGGMTITSDKVIVYYVGENKKPASKVVSSSGDKPTPKSDTSVAAPSTALSKIVGQGDFVMNMPDKKVAKADVGIYNVLKNRIILSGNVRLKQGGNTVSGEKFVYNVITGKSQMITRTKGGKSPRVKGRFVPAEVDKKSSAK